MQAVIKVRMKELDSRLIKKIKKLAGNDENADITISINDSGEAFLRKLDRSIEQLQDKKNLVTFSAEELMNYIPNKTKK